MAVVDGLVKRAAGAVAKAAGRTEAQVAAKELAGREAKMVGDRLVRSVGQKAAVVGEQAVAEPVAKEGFEAAFAAVKAKLKRDGAFFDAAKPLHEAVRQATTTDQALQVARLAQELAVKHNKANSGAAVAAMGVAIEKAAVLPEAQAALAQVVAARQSSYGLYSMAQKQKLTKAAVERLLSLASPEDEAVKLALKGVKPAFGQDAPASVAAKLAKKETLEEQAAGLVRYLREALD